MHEQKTLSLIDAKAAADSPNGQIEGYASVFNEVDSYGDTVAPGAYAETLPAFLRDGFISWGHDWSEPDAQVATPATAFEDSRGLYLTAEFHSTPDAQNARTIVTERLNRGKTMGLSIGYEALDVEYRTVAQPVIGQYGPTDKIRVLKRIKLYEVSLVSVPADAGALVVGAKSTLADHFARVLGDLVNLSTRSQALSELRAKEGRRLSEATREQLRAVASRRSELMDAFDEIDALLAATEPQKALDPKQVLLETQRVFARLNGVATS